MALPQHNSLKKMEKELIYFIKKLAIGSNSSLYDFISCMFYRYVEVGSKVSQFDSICEVQSDKVHNSKLGIFFQRAL